MKNQSISLEINERQKNMILLKSELGKVKQSTYDLPDENHFYGKALSRDKTGAKEASSEWMLGNQSRQRIAYQDFMELNRKGIDNGVHNSKTLCQFKSNHQYPQKQHQGSVKVDYVIPQFGFQYGVKNRPSTPIQYVIGNFYAIHQELQNQDKLQSTIDRQSKMSRSLQPIKNTKSTKFYQAYNKKYLEAVQAEQKALFKLSRFSNISSKVNTLDKLNISNKSYINLKNRNFKIPTIIKQ